MELMKRGMGLAMIMALVATPGASFGQDADFSNEKIWASGTFRTEYVWGIRSMADGKHYTTQEYDQNVGSCIVKWSYKTGNGGHIADVTTSVWGCTRNICADTSLAATNALSC